MPQEIPYQAAGFRDEENDRFVLVNPIFIGNLDSASSGDFITDGQHFNLSGVTQLQPANPPNAFISVDDDLENNQSLTGVTNHILTGSGYRMPFSGTVKNISMQLNTVAGSGNTTVTLFKNSSATAKTVVVDCTSTGSRGNHTAITPESFAAGDNLTFAITHSTGTLETSRHSGLIFLNYNESS